MNKIVILVLIAALSGCAISEIQERPPQHRMVFSNAEAIHKIVPGVSQKEVSQLVGQDVVIGYEYTINQKDQAAKYQPITVKNPYRSETLKRQQMAFEVDYYFTHINQADGVVTDDELTPLVFENSRLVGKGWPFLEKLVAQHRLK